MITEKIIKQASQILKNHNIHSHELDAQLILSNIMGVKREFLITNNELDISEKIIDKYDIESYIDIEAIESYKKNLIKKFEEKYKLIKDYDVIDIIDKNNIRNILSQNNCLNVIGDKYIIRLAIIQDNKILLSNDNKLLTFYSAKYDIYESIISF